MRITKIIGFLLALCAILVGPLLLVSGVLPYRAYVVHTGSMSPTIPSGSLVLVREHSYRPGQVVAYVKAGSVITHRIVAVNADGTFVTKGDANPTNDPWPVPSSTVVGGVVAAPRGLGFLVRYLRNPLGVASVLVAVLGIWQVWGLAEASVSRDSSGNAVDDPPARVHDGPRVPRTLSATGQSTVPRQVEARLATGSLRSRAS